MPSQTQVVTLESAGNGRVPLTPPVDGEQWRLGAVSTAEWTGYRWSRCSIGPGSRSGACEVRVPRRRRRKRATETGRRSRFERSLSIAEARDSNALLAYAMNGEPLPDSARLSAPPRRTRMVRRRLGEMAVRNRGRATRRSTASSRSTGITTNGNAKRSTGDRTGHPAAGAGVDHRTHSRTQELESRRPDHPWRGLVGRGTDRPSRRQRGRRVRGSQARLLGDAARATAGSGGSCITRLDDPGPETIRARSNRPHGRSQPERAEWNLIRLRQQRNPRGARRSRLTPASHVTETASMSIRSSPAHANGRQSARLSELKRPDPAARYYHSRQLRVHRWTSPSRPRSPDDRRASRLRRRADVDAARPRAARYARVVCKRVDAVDRHSISARPAIRNAPDCVGGKLAAEGRDMSHVRC